MQNLFSISKKNHDGSRQLEKQILQSLLGEIYLGTRSARFSLYPLTVKISLQVFIFCFVECFFECLKLKVTRIERHNMLESATVRCTCVVITENCSCSYYLVRLHQVPPSKVSTPSCSQPNWLRCDARSNNVGSAVTHGARAHNERVTLL